MASGKLIFLRPASGSGKLVLGDAHAESVTPNAELSIDAGFAGDGAAVLQLASGTPLSVDAGFAGEGAADVRLQWDANVSRGGVRTSLQSAWQQAAQPVSVAACAPWQIGQSLRRAAITRWQPAQPRCAAVAAHWQEAERLRAVVATHWQSGAPVRAGIDPAWQEAERLRAALATHWQDGSLLRGAFATHWQETERLRASVRSHWQPNGIPVRARTASAWGAARPVHVHARPRWQEAMRPPPGVSRLPVPPVRPPCYDPTRLGLLVFADPFTGSGRLLFRCERSGAGPEPGATVVVPVRRVYIVINNITLHRVDTGAELHAHSFSMSLDYQSWTWSWSASLHADAAPHLGRDIEGTPAELAVVVNGTPFRLRLVDCMRDRRFSPTRWSVSGQGKAATLAGPWAPVMSFGSPVLERSAQQLMADALTLNGVGIGWSVDWGLQDWQVPAGAWSMQGTYIDAINDIAAAVGGYVQPHNTQNVLRVLPKYPSAPWSWGSITPDFEIPEDAAEVEGTQFIDRPAYNRVFVGGVGAGVFGQFKRAGTAGDVLAPQATHALITDAAAHRQRGIAEISNTGRQEHITLSMQVLPETGIIVPGQFVRYLGDKPALGIVRSTSIDWSRPRLRQTLKLETHV